MRSRTLRVIYSRPRLVFGVLFGFVFAFILPQNLAAHGITRAILGWNAGAILYLILAIKMMMGADHQLMFKRARQLDEGRIVILVLVMLAAVVTLGAIVAELSVVKEMHGHLKFLHILLTGITIATSWAFTHVMFAMHYAHDYYGAVATHSPGGLSFPGTEKPDYADFLYFAFIIGTSGQTADVSFTSKEMRRTGLAHCVLAFFFNTTLLALTINIASGLI